MSTTEAKPNSSTDLVTAEQLLRDYNGQRCELVEGEVKLMSPTGFGHGSFERRLAQLLGTFVDEHDLGDVVAGEVGFVLSRNPDTVLAPDVAFVRKNRLEVIGITEKYFPEAPALAVEIVSPSDTAEEVDGKARRWLAAGTEAVWVVYPRGKLITIYRSLEDIRVLAQDQVLEDGDVVPGFTLAINDLFAGFVKLVQSTV